MKQKKLHALVRLSKADLERLKLRSKFILIYNVNELYTESSLATDLYINNPKLIRLGPDSIKENEKYLDNIFETKYDIHATEYLFIPYSEIEFLGKLRYNIDTDLLISDNQKIVELDNKVEDELIEDDVNIDNIYPTFFRYKIPNLTITQLLTITDSSNKHNLLMNIKFDGECTTIDPKIFDLLLTDKFNEFKRQLIKQYTNEQTI